MTDLERLFCKILAITHPYHTNFNPDGCKNHCTSCLERRNMRDMIKELIEEYEALDA